MRKVFSTAAMAIAFASAAEAQIAPVPAEKIAPPSKSTPGAPTATAPATPNAGLQSDVVPAEKPATLSHILPGDKMATKLIGAAVFSGSKEKLGEIGDLIVDKSGKIGGVVIVVGGVLGAPDRRVAVAYEALSFATDAEGRTSVTAPFTREMIEKAPVFQESGKS